MAEFLKFSEAGALALHALALVAKAEGPVSAAELARRLRASEAHVAKVLQVLARAGLLVSKRGPSGGYTLARPPEHIRLLDIYEAVDGELRRDGCVFAHPVCRGRSCIFGSLLGEVRGRVHQYFADTTLAEVVEAFSG